MKYYKHRQYPGLYEAMTLPDGLVRINAQGGGLARTMTEEHFASEFEQVDPVFDYRLGTVTADFLASDVIVPCYSNGKRWNGFGMPVFTLEVGKALLAAIPDLTYDEVRDAFVWRPCDGGGEEEIYAPTAILVATDAIKVYPIGTGSWTWDTVSLPCGSTT